MTSIVATRQTQNQKKNTLVTFSIEPILAYLDDLDCNNLAKNEGEWVLNENVAFDYSLGLEDVFKLVDIISCTCPYPSQKWHACI